MTDNPELQSQLEERLEFLERRVAGLEGDLRTAHSQDWEERATEISGDEVLEGLESAACPTQRRTAPSLPEPDES